MASRREEGAPDENDDLRDGLRRDLDPRTRSDATLAPSSSSTSSSSSSMRREVRRVRGGAAELGRCLGCVADEVSEVYAGAEGLRARGALLGRALASTRLCRALEEGGLAVRPPGPEERPERSRQSWMPYACTGGGDAARVQA